VRTAPAPAAESGKGSLGTPGALSSRPTPAPTSCPLLPPVSPPSGWPRDLLESRGMGSPHPGIRPGGPAGFQQGDRPLVATVGRRAAAGSSTGRCQATAPLSLGPRSPCARRPLFFLDRKTGGSKLFEHKRRNAEEQCFRNTATRECFFF